MSLRPTTRRRLADAGLFVSLVLALGALVASGLPVWLVAVGLGAVVGLETLLGAATRRAVLAEVPTESPGAALQGVVAEMAAEFGTDPPRVRLADDDGAGVTVLAGPDGPELVFGRGVADALDRPGLRGVVAHELAHLSRGHLGVDARRPATHAVGFSACWVLVLQGLPGGVAVAGGLAYILLAVLGLGPVGDLLYVLASGGLVIVPVALTATAHRAEEHAADDLAVAHAEAVAFGRALSLTAAADERLPRDLGSRRRPAAALGVLGRLTSSYPTLQDRLDRLGVDPADLAD